MDIDSFIVYIQTEQIAKEVEARLQIMNKKDPWLEGKIKKVIELLKDKLGGEIMTVCHIKTKIILVLNR